MDDRRRADRAGCAGRPEAPKVLVCPSCRWAGSGKRSGLKSHWSTLKPQVRSVKDGLVQRLPASSAANRPMPTTRDWCWRPRPRPSPWPRSWTARTPGDRQPARGDRRNAGRAVSKRCASAGADCAHSDQHDRRRQRPPAPVPYEARSNAKPPKMRTRHAQ